MKHIYKRLIILFLLSVLISGCKSNNTNDNDSMDVLPDLQLKVNNPEELKYLGVKKNVFKLSQINADYVIIEIFSMYCPKCQKAASDTVRLFTYLKNKKLDEKVKMFGIAATNTLLEADIYRAKYKIPFPLTSDKETELATSLGVSLIPHFILAKRNQEGRFVIIYQQNKGPLNLELIKKKLNQ